MRLLFYRMSLASLFVDCDYLDLKKKEHRDFYEVFILEFLHLYNVAECVVTSLPKNPSDEWRSLELDEWLLVSYHIKPFQCEKIDYDEFFRSGKNLGGVDACGLGKFNFDLITLQITNYTVRLGDLGTRRC
jgi:hypothetical protein